MILRQGGIAKRVVEGAPSRRRDAEFPAASCYCVAPEIERSSWGGIARRRLTMVQVMNSQYIGSTVALAALLLAACSSGGSYGGSSYSSGSYSSGTYDSGGYGANSGAVAGSSTTTTTAGSGSSVTGSLGSDIHSVVHEEKQEARIRKAQKTEPLLGASGFKSMPIDNPAKQKVIGGLTPLSFNRLAHHGKIHYWFADPYYCKCVYVGDELAYLRYKQAKQERKQDKVEEANLIDSENQVDLPMDSQWDPVSAFGMP
jgi:hypothetical protein